MCRLWLAKSDKLSTQAVTAPRRDGSMGGAASTRRSRLNSRSSPRETSITEVNMPSESYDNPETTTAEKTDMFKNGSKSSDSPVSSIKRTSKKSLGRENTGSSMTKVKETQILCGLKSTKTSNSKVICDVSKRQDSLKESSDVKTNSRPSSSNVQLEDSQAPKDLMISYSHADREMMLKVRETLESNGISVWVDVSGLRAGVDFLSKIGQAIIDAKSFIILLSKNSVKSKYCQDELALAYISNKAVFPVNMQPQETLIPLMTTGERLQLAGLNWISLVDPNQEDGSLQELVRLIKEEIVEREIPAKIEMPVSRPHTARQRLNKRRRLNKQQEHDKTLTLMPREYWKQHYQRQVHVDWQQFVQDFLSMYTNALSNMYSQDDQNWLVSVLRREMEVQEHNQLEFEMFVEFCTIDGEEQPFWQRVQDQARESSAMKEVFNMTSEVRVTAIENLGKFRSTAVIDALRDLLTDANANVRAVAAVSLARTNANDTLTVEHIMKCLKDNDRLVREAGCLALGHLKAKKAVKKILHIWRNDVISNVREAAAVALQLIGGDVVEKEMHLTKVLADEIRQLTQ